MKLTAHQPCYMPWPGLIAKIISSDEFVSYDHVQYQPKSFNNRNFIRRGNDDILLTVPVIKSGFLTKKYKDIIINDDGNWRAKHIKTIELAYKKFDFWHDYSESLFGIISNKNITTLVELNNEILKWILGILEIKRTIQSSDALGLNESKSAGVLEMCLKKECKEYLFGEQGKDYCDRPSFLEAGVVAKFQEFKFKEIPGWQNYERPVSIISLLFEYGIETKRMIMAAHTELEVFDEN